MSVLSDVLFIFPDCPGIALSGCFIAYLCQETLESSGRTCTFTCVCLAGAGSTTAELGEEAVERLLCVLALGVLALGIFALGVLALSILALGVLVLLALAGIDGCSVTSGEVGTAGLLGLLALLASGCSCVGSTGSGLGGT